MSEDKPRTGPEDSGFVTVVSGDGSTPQTAVDIPDLALFRVESIRIQYASTATVNAEVAIHDDADGTTAANLGSAETRVLDIAAGDTVELDGSLGAFEEGVLVATQGNQDADLDVTVKGTRLTDLRDMT